MLVREGNNYISDGIYGSLVKTKCCRKAYLRGVFMGAGTVSDPGKSYHLEIVCGSRNLTKIERMNGYLSYSRVKGDTRLNAAKMAEIAERKSM